MMPRMVRCIKNFMVQECDGDGFEIRDRYSEIEKGSVWEIDLLIVDNDTVRLFSIDDNYRLEVPREDYKELFD